MTKEVATVLSKPWPKREDGSNMTMGEMTAAQRREQIAASVERIKAAGIGHHTADFVARSLLR